MKTQTKQKNPYQTILVICTGLAIIYLWSQWKWTIWVAVLIGLLGIFSPFMAKKIDYLWMQFAYLLSLFLPNIILSLIYFLLLVPLAMLSRLLNRKDVLQLKESKRSTFKSINKTFQSSSFENPW